MEGVAFDLYEIFVIEERHGYNRQTLGLFVADFLKSSALLMAIQAPLIVVIIWLLNNGAVLSLHLGLFVSVCGRDEYLFPVLIAVQQVHRTGRRITQD